MAPRQAPLVCTETLHSLEESLFGERELCRNFVFRYIDMWPGRFERIHTALSSGDCEQAMDAILGLRSSSIMVGAAQLGQLSTDLIKLLEKGRLSTASHKISGLRACGIQTTSQLQASYLSAA